MKDSLGFQYNTSPQVIDGKDSLCHILYNLLLFNPLKPVDNTKF
ncbi:hypothetical protein CWATWH8502_3013 [Crocosphaera watsonii WH 8502]|uniref:Uncharacterized protein n=2 Tax=Crocosphaera watsonii TaxID=263511 RepID=T2JWK3_CROWT|nr:hypothetical protein CWATWH8502_3013 [Crocosphaera watsonii WH 8502]CCQ69444.1 hypothetical protein CWATWH0402_4179 [Crocosphaera watsonii WH 0402]